MMSKVKTLTLFIFLSCGLSFSQNPFEDAIKQISSDNVKGYLQPIVNGLGANLNSGIYHQAPISKLGFHLRLKFVGMGTLIGDGEKTYSALPPQPFNQERVKTATVFGGTGKEVQGPGGVTYQFQNGQIKTNIFPFALPQLTIGNLFGTQAIIRYVPVPEIGDFPKVTLFGIGAIHDIGQHFILLPVDIRGGAFYQTFTVGDIMEANTFNLAVFAGKTFFPLTIFGGLQYETSTIDLSYTYTGPGTTANSNVSLSLKGENTVRFITGFSINLPVISLQGDISLGKVTVVSAGLSLGI